MLSTLLVEIDGLDSTSSSSTSKLVSVFYVSDFLISRPSEVDVAEQTVVHVSFCLSTHS